MGMDNYKLTYEDGTETHVQIDDSEDTGKAILETYKEAAKSSDNVLKSIAKGDPKPDNAKGSSS